MTDIYCNYQCGKSSFVRTVLINNKRKLSKMYAKLVTVVNDGNNCSQFFKQRNIF